MIAEADVVAHKLAKVFDALGIPYLVGGSIASSVHGIPRLTHDVDMVAALQQEHIQPLVAALESDFYIDGDMIHRAISDGSSFNVIYLPLMVKADIFVRQATPWEDLVWKRRVKAHIGQEEEETEPLFVASAEDMILQKLHWYRLTGERSDRQWGDVQGMLKIQGAALDLDYLHHWAAELELSDLLAQAFEDAGIE